MRYNLSGQDRLSEIRKLASVWRAGGIWAGRRYGAVGCISSDTLPPKYSIYPLHVTNRYCIEQVYLFSCLVPKWISPHPVSPRQMLH
jgi:hypothetical protein